MRCPALQLALSLVLGSTPAVMPARANGWSWLLAPAVERAFEQPRSPLGDVIHLRSGDVLVGRLAWDAIIFQTPLGEVVLPGHRVAGLDLGDREGRAERLLTVTGDRLSGLLLAEEFPLMLAGGTVQPVPRCLVSLVICQRREEERQGIPRRQWVQLTNGDHFTGAVVGAGRLVFDHSRPLDLSQLAWLAPRGWAPRAEAAALTGAPWRGELDRPSLSVIPDVSAGMDRAAALEVPLERLSALLGQPGAVLPELAPPPAAPAPVLLAIDELRPGASALTGDLTDGPDLFHFRALRGQTYKIQTENLSGCDTVLSLWSEDQRTRLAENDDADPMAGPASMILWTCPADGVHFVRVRDLQDRRAGTYAVRVERVPGPVPAGPGGGA